MNPDGGRRPGVVDYDAELRRHDDVLRGAAGIRSTDHVLDIGCGTGHTTRWAARAAPFGDAVGVDVSAPAIERAGQLADAAGLGNVAHECADAQTHRFLPARFDVAISRFGTMFFADPVAAFANVRRSLRPGGRLVMMVWQAHDRNEWSVALRRSLDGGDRPAVGAAAGPDPFSLADPSVVTEVLAGAGFVDVAFTDVEEPVYYGPDPDAALEWVGGFTCTKQALTHLDPADVDRAVARLRQVLAAHQRPDGVWFGACAWIVTARRP